jgi:predicted aspartyl protease
MPILNRKPPPHMGRIYTHVTITNARDESKSMRIQALVDTGASHMVLPSAWKEQLGELTLNDSRELETATQSLVHGEVCGPVIFQIDGFRPVSCDVLFIDMEPTDGIYEPLVGYIPLEQSGAAVDMLGHRLLHIKHFALK